MGHTWSQYTRVFIGLLNMVDKEERFDIIVNNTSKIKNYILEKTI